MKRYNIFGIDEEGYEEDPEVVSCHDGPWCDAEEALAEIVKRDSRIAELEAERDELLEKARGLRDELNRLGGVKRRGSGCCSYVASNSYEHAAEIVNEVFDLADEP